MKTFDVIEQPLIAALRPKRARCRRQFLTNVVPSLVSVFLAMVSALVLAWLASGCASPSGDPSAPKPGSGIAEYRVVTRDAHRAVADTVKSLEALAQPHAQTSSPHPALRGFDRKFHQLELTSVKTRARAEAIIARGQAYFDEWKTHLASLTNQTTAQAESQQYARLFEHFQRVRERSGEVREEFRPFMAGLREFRARLDRPSESTGGGSDLSTLNPQLSTDLIAGGRRVLQKLETVSAALDDAEAELQVTLAAQTKK
jgi:hypothetical protein